MLLYGDIGLLLADPEFEFLFLFLNRDELIPLLDPFDLIEIFADEKAILFSNWDVFCSRLLICKWSINKLKLEQIFKKKSHEMIRNLMRRYL